MADPTSHIDDYIGYIDESTYGTTPDSNPVFIGSDVVFEAGELPNRSEIQGSGNAALTFAREPRGARQFSFKLAFLAWGTAYLKFIEYALGVAAGGGQITRSLDSFSLVTRKGPTGSYKWGLMNGCMVNALKVTGELNKPIKLELEGPCQYVEPEDTANFAGLQNVDLSDNTWPPAMPSTDPIVWYGGGPTAAKAFKWGTHASYDNKPTLTELLQIPKWTLEVRRNLKPIVGRKQGADSAEYHLALDQVPQQAQVSLGFNVPRKAYGSLAIDFAEKADRDDAVVYVEVPVDSTYVFDLRNGKIRIGQHKVEGRAAEIYDIRIDRFNYLAW